MVDLTPLKEAFEVEGDPEKKQLLKVAIDLFSAGCKGHFQKMWKKGEHRRWMSPLGAAALDKVMEGFYEEKKQGWNVVCAIPAKEMEKEAFTKKKEEESVTKIAPLSTQTRKGKGKIIGTPLNRCSARLLERRRRCGGGGVKIREPEEEKEEKEEQKSDDDVEIIAEAKADDAGEKPRDVIDISSDDELSSDEKVAKINAVLLSYLDELPPEAIDSEFGY